MIRRTTRITLEVVAAAVVGISVGVGLVAWRLSTGPVSIDFLTPYLEEALNVRTDDLTVRVDDTVLTWGGWGRPVEVHAVGLWAVQDDGTARAVVPEMTVRFGFRSLLRGAVAPTSLEVQSPNLRLVRTETGRLAFGMEEEAARAAPFLPRLIDTLLGEPQGGVENYLSSIRIADAKLTIEDRMVGQSWQASKAEVIFERDVLGLRASVAVDVDVAGGAAQFDAVGVYDRTEGTIKIGASFAGLDIAALAPKGEMLAPLRIVRIPLDGVVSAVMDTSGWVAEAGFEVRGESGTLETTELLGRALPVRRLEARGRITDGLERLAVDRASIDFGGPTVFLNGDIDGLGRGGEVRIGLIVRDLPGDDLGDYWPAEMAANGRRWMLANTGGGTVREITADIRLRRGAGGDAIELLNATGGGRFEGGAIRFLEGQPPVRDASGTFTFDADGIDVTLTEGRIEDLVLDSAQVRLLDFDEPAQVARISGAMRGGLRRILALADREPYRYVRSLGIDAARIDGSAAARFGVELPLVKTLDLNDVAIEVEADLTQVSWSDAPFGVDLSDGALRLVLDTSKMDVAGTARLYDTPAKLTWSEHFEANSDYRRKMSLNGRFEPEDRARLGLDFGGYVGGPINADVTMTTWADGHSRVQADMELTGSWLEIPVLGWQKEAAIPAQASLTLELENDRVTEISSFVVEGGDLSAKGRATLVPRQRRVEWIEADLKLGAMTDARLTASRREDGSYGIEVAGDRFDASTILHDEQPTDAFDYPPFSLDARLGALYFAPDRFVSGTAIAATHDGEDWTSVSFRGTVGEGKTVAADYLPNGDGNRLRIHAEDAGAAFRAVNLVDTVVGGTLDVSGATRSDDPGVQFGGKVQLVDYRVVNAPVLAKLFTLASFRGIGDVLSGEDGIGFARFRADYTVSGDTITVSKGRAQGSEVGFTVRGDVDLAKDAVDLRGTLVPAYTLNSLLGNIPLLGPLFVGEQGSGIFAATYTVAGSIEEPETTVNPLAALTPGFLRILLGAFSGSVDVPDDFEPHDFEYD